MDRSQPPSSPLPLSTMWFRSENMAGSLTILVAEFSTIVGWSIASYLPGSAEHHCFWMFWMQSASLCLSGISLLAIRSVDDPARFLALCQPRVEHTSCEREAIVKRGGR
ncbi:hypothetical protein VTI28DRAFT_9767 [Corynascus sepedonium]